MSTMVSDYKIGDVALNWLDLPIEITGIGDGYLISDGMEWTVNGDGKLTPYHPPAASANGNGANSAAATPNMLKAALWYAGHNWRVMPLHEPLFNAVDSHGKPTICTCEEWRRYEGNERNPANPAYVCDTPGKHPRIGDWESRATIDPAQVRKWWWAWPTANIGIAAGASNLVVVDKDTYNELAGDGTLTIADTETVTSLTGGGGEHLIYKHPEDGPQIRNDDKALPAWVNIRAHGGQFVAPPSLHMSGNRYEWEPGYSPREYEAAPLPDALCALLQSDGDGERRRAAPISERIAAGGRNNTLTSLAGSMRRRGLGAAVIEAALLKVNDEQCDPPLPEDEVKAIAKSVSQYAPSANSNGVAGGGLPIIVVSGRHLREISDDAYNVLLAANNPPQVYQYGGQLARVTAADGRAGVQLLDQTMLRYRLSRVADFLTIKTLKDGTQQSWVTASDRLIADILAYPEWPGMPALGGVVTAPVVSPNGQARIEPGYDPATALYYHAGGPLAIGDTDPTDERLRWAIGLILNDLLGDFPFKDEASRANAVALFILPFARPLIEGCTPLHILNAPTPGTGKTLLARGVTLPFNPDGPAVMTAGQDEDEWRKRITALLSGGASHLSIDNIKGALTSGSLASALTTPLWTDRILGKSQTITLPNRAVWIATGNNIAVDSELARRSVWIRLDSNTEKPWTRNGFKHPALEEWTQKHRGDLVTVALILIRHWFKSGCPPGRQTVGGFESWARVIGGILDTAGIVGFMGNADELYELSDPAAAQWAAFIAEWYQQFGESAVGVKELFRLADSEPGGKPKEQASLSDELAADSTGLGLLDEVLKGNTPRARKVSLGNLIRERKDTVIDGFKIESAGKLHRASMYHLARLGA